MKKLLITLALFFWAMIVGEIVNGLIYREGMLLALLAQDLNDARQIAAFVSRVMIVAVLAVGAVIFTVPTVLYLRRRMPLFLSSVCAALVLCLFWFIVEFAVAGALKEGAYKGFLLFLGQGFFVAYAAARFWPKRQQNVREVFE